MESALVGLRVLDVSSGVAGSYCTKLLADLGADVLKVEGREGDLARRLGPFPRDIPDPEKSGFFLYLNAGKRSCVLDLEGDPAARDKLQPVIANADVLVENLAEPLRQKLGLDFETLGAANPKLITVSVTPFGLTGPMKDWQVEEIVEWALGGWMYFCGDPARPPLMIPGHQAELQAGMHAAFATLAGVYDASHTGQGQHIDLSEWESVLSDHAWLSAIWTHCGAVMRRRGADFLRCADGLVFIIRAIFYNPNLFLLMERPELADDARWGDISGWIANSPELWSIVEEWTQDRSKHEVVTKAQELRMAATPVNTVGDLVASPQLAARDWFVEVDHPAAGKIRLPGVPYKLSATPARPAGPAPLLGEHTAEALSGRLWPPREASQTRAGARDRVRTSGPLDGIKVVELTSNWAGPMSGRLLGDLGAEVIKVELASRPAARVHYYVGDHPGKYHYNRAGYFNNMNRNKLGISLDISKPNGKEVFLRLIQRADVFIENNSPRVVRNLGISYDALKEANPQLIMLSESGLGATGPQAEYLAFGTNIEASCGLVSVIGYGPGDNFRTGSFYADPVAGTHGAAAVVAALLHRERSGVGQYIDLALQEAAAAFMGEFLMDYLLNGRVAEPRANRHPHYAPQGSYPCFGEDMWVVLCVRSDDEWQRFCGAVGHPEWAERPEFATEEDRRRQHDSLDELITSWTKEQDHWEAARILQQAGVPAAPVLLNWEIVTNQHLFERGFYVPVPHREAGVLPYPGFPWKFSRTPGSIRMGAPCFAEHNDLVYRKILGLSEEEIHELTEQGLIGTIPQQPVLRGTL